MVPSDDTPQRKTDRLEARLDEIRDVLDRIRFGFPGQRWRITAGPGEGKAVVQTSAGHFVGHELPPGQTVRMQTRMVVAERVGRIGLAGERLHCHVFSRFPFQLTCDGREIVRCPDPPIIRGRVLAEVVPELVPGRSHELVLTIEVPDNLVAYGFRLAFSTPRLRDRWHEGDRAWARLLLAAECDTRQRDTILRTLGERADDLMISTVDTFPDLLAAPAPLVVVPGDPSVNQVDPELREPTVLSPTNLSAGPLADSALPTVHLVGHAHLDVEWLWTWTQAKRAAKAVCSRAADLMDSDPHLRFTFTQPMVYDMLRREAPDLFARVHALVQEGRWEPATATWVEHDMNLPSAESIARQLTAGQRFSEEHLGIQPEVCVAVDTFGHPASLPGLLTKAGCVAYYHTRCHPLPRDGGPAYRWVGPDGSSVVGVVTDAYDGELLASRVAQAAVQARRAGLSAGLVLFDVDGHTGEEVREALDRFAGFPPDHGLPPVRWSGLRDYVDAVADQSLPVFSGVPPTIYEGTYTGQVLVKQANRRAEVALQEAEALCCMAGLDQRQVLDCAWRRVLGWQNHDTLAGTGMAAVYDRLAAHIHEVQHRVERVARAAIARLTTGLSADFAVVNPTPWLREEWLVVNERVAGAGQKVGTAVAATGEHHPVQQGTDGAGFLIRAEPWSVTGYRLLPGEPTPEQAEPVAPLECGEDAAAEVFVGEENRKDYFAVRNRYWSLLVRGDAGAIVSMVLADDGPELVAYGIKRRTTFTNTARPELGLNVLQIVRERPHAMSAWHVHEVYSETSLLHTGETSWLEQGPLRAVLRTRHAVGATTIEQDMTFYRDLPRIDVTLTVDWQEPGGNNTGVTSLKVACTPDLAHTRVHAGVPAGVVERPANGQEYPMQRWVDCSDGRYGVAMIAEDRYGFDALGPRIRISLVRGSYDPAAAADVGRHVIRYTILPHRGIWREAALPVLAERLSQRLVVAGVACGDAPAGGQIPLPVPDAGDPGLVSCVKWADDGNGVICRIVDWSGVGGITRLNRLPADATCWRATLTGQPIERLTIIDQTVEVTVPPNAVETILIRSSAYALDVFEGAASG